MRIFILCFCCIFLCIAVGIAQTPTTLFDVRNGGPTSTVIEFKDNIAKQAVIDAVAETGSWSVTLTDAQGQPITKQQFFHREIAAFLNQRVKAARYETERKKIVVKEDDLPSASLTRP